VGIVSRALGGTGRLQRRQLTTLSLGHLFADLTQGVVPALLPFLVAHRSYSYAEGAALVMGATVSSSVVQPVFGHLSDRRIFPWLIPGGLAVGGVGIALAGVASSRELTFLAVVLGGLGVAAFHPEASRRVAVISGNRRATAMGLFAVGGNAGFALGPLVATPLLLFFGPPGTLALLAPAAFVVYLSVRELPRAEAAATAPGPSRPAHRAEGVAATGAFLRLTVLIVCRSVFYFGVSTFLALYFIQSLGDSAAEANGALAAMLVGGVGGTVLGGVLADRFGRRRVLVISLLPVGPLTLALLAAHQPLATAIAAVIGALTIASFSLTLVMGQEYLPHRIGVASGVAFGFAIGLGGVGASLAGLFADQHGVRATLELLALLPIVAAALALTLPSRTPYERGNLSRLQTSR
jgi:MFS transporter, FSR family, fosmidomycin resistance protein